MSIEDNEGLSAVVEAARESVNAADRVTEIRNLPVAVVPDGMNAKLLHDVLNEEEKRKVAPTKLMANRQLDDVASFCEYSKLFNGAKSSYWVHAPSGGRPTVNAIFDDHKPESPNWAHHQAYVTLNSSEAWDRWTSQEGKFLTQEQFTDLIEERFDDLATPKADSPADKDMPSPIQLLEMAKNLAIHSTGTFERKINPTTGETVLIAKDEQNSSSTVIPPKFILQLQPFEFCEHYRVEAFLRFKLRDNTPTFRFSFRNKKEVRDDAVNDVVKHLADKGLAPVYRGRPG